MDTNNKNKKGSTKRNFIMICFAYTCATTSLNAVVNLQSSLNTDKDVGLNSVAITYGASLLTCIFLTTPLGYIFGYKWSIVGGQFGILVYVASNMYPKQWLMYSTAIICGSLRACFSMAQNSYVTALANDESENDDDAEIKTRKYFGIFFTAFQSAQIWGNLISYLVLRNTPKTTNTNSTQCGANYLTSEHQMQDDNHQLISQKTIYILYSTLSGIIFVSIVLTIILLVQRRDNKKEDDSQGLLRKSLNSILSTWKTALKPNHLLLIPLGFWTLSGEAFFMGAFTNSFITCTIGVQYVAMYNSMLPDKNDESYSLLTCVQEAASLIIFFYATMLRVRTQIILQLIYLTLAMLSYIIISIKQRRTSTNDDDDQQTFVLNRIVLSDRC
ncbi:unnamed protein product [Adineta steineri]|uniref:Uncharacterized protein n=1 Tax=Adineta steineri TaxID=433720 RepID=A0A819CIG7_9BILA|nr:unnamed protein product [Adineta steineri]